LLAAPDFRDMNGIPRGGTMQIEANQPDATWFGYLSWQSGDPAEPAPYWRHVRDRVVERAEVCAGDRVLDVGSGTGLLAFGAARKAGTDGLVIACDADQDVLKVCANAARGASPRFDQTRQVQGDAYRLPLLSQSMDVAIARGIFCHLVDKRPVLGEVFRVLKRAGRLSCHEPIARKETRLSELVDLRGLGSLAQDFIAAERAVWEEPGNPMLNFDEYTLAYDLREAGFVRVSSTLERLQKQRHATESYLHDFWYKQWVPGERPLYQLFMTYLDKGLLDKCVEFINGRLRDTRFTQELVAAVITATRP